MSDARRVFVAGHLGLVGSAIVRALRDSGEVSLLVAPRSELDLRDAAAVDSFFARHKPEQVYLAAAKVGGIHANAKYPAEFLADNLAIQLAVLNAARKHAVRKLLFLGSSCIYPKFAPQPIPESALLTGPLEPTNEAYAIAKIAGIKLCQSFRRQHGCNFICVMPTNLYGPHDNFDLQTSHVMPALICKCHNAKLADQAAVTVWGTGTPRREFLHVDDLADACIFLMQHYDSDDIINIGTGTDIAISELAALVADVVGFRGTIEFDTTMPDGTPRKLLDVSRLNALGWRPRISLREGVRLTYGWYADAHPVRSPASL